MKGRLILCAAALLGLLAVNLHCCCAVSFGGEALAERCGPAALLEGLRAADAAAVEILSSGTGAAQPELRWSLTLRPPEGEARRLADAALRATEGVRVCDGVYVGGAQFGVVTNGSQLLGRLQAWLYDTMPRGARHAGFVEAVTLRPVYARAEAAKTPGEMLAAVTEAVPAWYTDAAGHPVRG